MQGLHLTGDLFDCGCQAALLTDLDRLSTLCRDATVAAGLTIVDEKFHVFPDWNGHPGGITGALLLAESHLAVHTWPERRGVTLDVYVCNFSADNSAKAEQLFNDLMVAFRPRSQTVNRIHRGDVAEQPAPHADAPSTESGQLVFDWLNAHAGYGFTATPRVAFDSAFQRVEVFDSQQFGRLFRLDGRLMTSERDEFFYHECMVHPALLAHPRPESVLVLGGGDGGSSEEILKHPSVRRVVMAELDPAVIEVAREHLGGIHRGVFDDPRLQVCIGDGLEFVRSTAERFDLIVLDLTDPDTPAVELYSEPFFRLCQRILNPGGLMTLHMGSPVYQPDSVVRSAQRLRRVFRTVQPMSLFIPLYGSLWCLGVATDAGTGPATLDPDRVAERMTARGLEGLRYYNPEVHRALFALPNFVRDLTGSATAREGQRIDPGPRRLAA